MNLKDIHGSVAQALSMAMWASDIAGHPAVGTILHNPQTAQAIDMTIAGLLGLWGIAHSIYLAWIGKQLREEPQGARQ